MNKIQDVVFKPTAKPKYIKLYQMEYNQNDKKKSHDLFTTPNSVSILIYHRKRDSFIFVKQFRPTAYFAITPPEYLQNGVDLDKYPPELGITLELCTGIIDKRKSILQIAKEEILEECGYDVPIEKFEKIYSFYTDYQMSGTQVGYYCEVSDDMRVSSGGGIDDELIEVVEMTVSEVKDFVNNGLVNSPTNLVAAVYWFLCHKKR